VLVVIFTHFACSLLISIRHQSAIRLLQYIFIYQAYDEVLLSTQLLAFPPELAWLHCIKDGVDIGFGTNGGNVEVPSSGGSNVHKENIESALIQHQRTLFDIYNL